MLLEIVLGQRASVGIGPWYPRSLTPARGEGCSFWKQRCQDGHGPLFPFLPLSSPRGSAEALGALLAAICQLWEGMITFSPNEESQLTTIPLD